MNCIIGSPPYTSLGYSKAYLQVGHGSGYRVLAHRMAFEKAWSMTLRPDQVVRHTCDNPPCVNPLHLQVGAPKDNTRDMIQRGRYVNGQGLKTHCLRGHEFSKENTYLTSIGSRQCRACEGARNQHRSR